MDLNAVGTPPDPPVTALSRLAAFSRDAAWKKDKGFGDSLDNDLIDTTPLPHTRIVWLDPFNVVKHATHVVRAQYAWAKWRSPR